MKDIMNKWRKTIETINETTYSRILKKIEDKYGPISKDDFFSDNLETYFKANKPEERGEGGGVTSTVIRLPSFVKLFNFVFVKWAWIVIKKNNNY